MATGFDLVGLLLIIIMSVSGLKKGLIDGVLKMVGVYAAIYASMHYNQYGTALIEPFIQLPDTYKVPAGFVIMFLVVMYSITLISFILRKLVKTMHLGAIDRLGGITFGALKAGLILSAFVWAFAMVPEDRRGTWQKESKLYPIVEVFAGNMVKILSLEDELTTLQSMMDPDADKTELIQKALGGEDGEGMGGILSKLGNIGSLTGGKANIQYDEDGLPMVDPGQASSDAISKILDSFEGPQKEIIEQAMQAMRTGKAHSIMEGAIQSKDSTGASLLDEAMKYMNPNEKSELQKKIKEMDAGMQVREQSIFEKQY